MIGAQLPAAMAAIEARAAALDTPLLRQGIEWDARRDGDTLYYEGPAGGSRFPLPALAGAHQIGNAGIAIAGVEALEAGALPLAAKASEHAVDDRRHFLNRQCPLVGIAVDEEGWRGIHLEFIRTAFLHCSHIVQKFLVRQAGLKGLL